MLTSLFPNPNAVSVVTSTATFYHLNVAAKAEGIPFKEVLQMVKCSQNLVVRQIPNYDNDKLVSCMLLQVCLLYLETGTVLSHFIWQLKIISRSITVKNLSLYPQYSYFLYKKMYCRNHLNTS